MCAVCKDDALQWESRIRRRTWRNRIAAMVDDTEDEMSDNAFRDAQDRYGLNFRHLTEHTVRSLEMLLGCDGHPDEILGKVKELLKEHENARREAEGRIQYDKLMKLPNAKCPHCGMIQGPGGVEP